MCILQLLAYIFCRNNFVKLAMQFNETTIVSSIIFFSFPIHSIQFSSENLRNTEESYDCKIAFHAYRISEENESHQI